MLSVLPYISFGRFGHADVVVEGLRHLALAVGAGQQRHGEDHLLGLTVGSLDVATQQQVELLIGPAELDIRLDRDGVVSLHDRIEQLEHRDRLARGEALGEVVALEQLRDGGRAQQREQLAPSTCRATRR